MATVSVAEKMAPRAKAFGTSRTAAIFSDASVPYTAHAIIIEATSVPTTPKKAMVVKFWKNNFCKKSVEQYAAHVNAEQAMQARTRPTTGAPSSNNIKDGDAQVGSDEVAHGYPTEGSGTDCKYRLKVTRPDDTQRYTSQGRGSGSTQI